MTPVSMLVAVGRETYKSGKGVRRNIYGSMRREVLEHLILIFP